MRTRDWRKVLRDFFTISIPVLVLTALVLEAALRLCGYKLNYLDGRAFIPSKNPEILYELCPGFRGLYAATPISINSEGFRGEELLNHEAPAFRIAVIGDSIAFGQGVQEGETLAGQLSARLRQKLSAPVEVINFGVPGYNTTQEYWTFKERALPLGPQVCLVLYCANDTDPPPFQIKDNKVMSPDLRIGIGGDFHNLARKKSALYNLVWMRWHMLKYRVVSIEKYREQYAMKFSDANPGWKKSQSSLVDLISLARARSIRTIVIPFPLPWGLREKPYPFQFYIDAVSETAKAAGAECLDVVPILQDPSIREHVGPVEPHPSAQVYARIAEELEMMLR